MPQDSAQPPWWGAKAHSLLGQRLLLGVTVGDEGGDVVAQAQFHGRLVEADAHQGFALELADGGLAWLPPDLRAFEPAVPGEYRLRSTGEVVVDPDLLANWTVNAEPEGREAGWSGLVLRKLAQSDEGV
jgi:hypothetical protein